MLFNEVFIENSDKTVCEKLLQMIQAKKFLSLFNYFSRAKAHVLIFFLLTNSFIIRAQQTPCAFDSLLQKSRHRTEIANKKIAAKLNRQSVREASGTGAYVIPVVVHVVHNGGTENITDAQIQSQIDALNEDFRKIAGTAGDGSGADTQIEFCLAKKDPQGRCTNGIVRIQSALTNHQSYQRADLAQLSSWDATRYLNIYVVKSIAGSVLGYASFPGGPGDQDGCVIVHKAFGRMGTAAAPNNKGRTATHELGHWLGLYHTFNGGCGNDLCMEGDLVCDTPPVINPNFGCPGSINSCNNDAPDLDDQIQNYMDYTDDDCKSVFTQGQAQRMQATLAAIRTSIWTQANLVSTGCDSSFVAAGCNVIADFTSNGDTLCLGSSVLFTNRSLNAPTSYQWYFAGGTPETATTANVQVTYDSLGTFPVKLIVFGANGSDSIIKNDYISVVTPQAGQALPFNENFEDSVFPPANFVIDNPDHGITWERDTIAVAYNGEASAKINNLINTNYGQSDALVLPPMDFTTATGAPYLSFKWAYARSDANYSDDMIVLVTKDCGINWSQVFSRSGSALVTGATQTTPYIPDTTTVWKSANINLNSYATCNRVVIKIVNVTDGGNNLYIDNLNIYSNSTGLTETQNQPADFLIYPNPAGAKFFIEYIQSIDAAVYITLSDILGRTIYEMKNENQDVGFHKQEINCVLQNGMYNVTMRNGNRISNGKIVINKP